MCYWRCLLVFDSPPTPLLHTWICLRDAAFQGSDNKHEKQIGQPFDSMRTECTVMLRSPEQPLCSCPLLAFPLLQPAEHCLVLRFALRCWAPAVLSRILAGGCCGCLAPRFAFLPGKQSCGDSWERLCVPEWPQRSSITSGLQWVPWGKSHPYPAAAGASILFCGSLVSVKILVSNLVKDVKNVGCNPCP